VGGAMRGRARIKRIRVEEGAEAYSQTTTILSRLDGLPVKHVKPFQTWQGPGILDPDKETLRLLPFQGEFLKPCPGTKEYICCGYQILHAGTNCPLDCSYCILQAYFNQPELRIFVNLESKLDQIGDYIDRNSGKVFRIGTGEFMDSLALEPVVGWRNILFPFLSERMNVVLELKTKTEQVDGLLSSPWRDRIIVSWSLNSPSIAAVEEKGAPSIRKRLEAARRCQDEGFVVGFHFDPLIEHQGWKSEYRRTVDMMVDLINPNGIIWISLGCLRYMPLLKRVIRRRHPGSHVLDGEFILGFDGKMRYFKPMRIAMYTCMAEILNQWHDDLGIYLCMESDEIWQRSLGWSPEHSEGLSRYLDQRATRVFGMTY
jgi:spore photoproduct lyase